MENLHLKNLKHKNLDIIKQKSWFKEFTDVQQYYIEQGIKNNIDINKFAKKEIYPDDMLDILTELEIEKYGEVLTQSYYLYKLNTRLNKETYTKFKQKLDKI